MSKYLSFTGIILLLTSCYSVPEIDGFDKEEWLADFESCEDTKLALARTIIAHQELILGEGQAEVKALLGQPSEHELYRRNQKFFYYNLTPTQDSCEITGQRLSIRFDALDRVKELMIIEL